MNVMLAIVYAPDGRKPLSIARVRDRALLAAAAEKAILEAQTIASSLMKDNPALAAIQFEEADKLRRVFGRLLRSDCEPTLQ
jgi:hypothetical protein